LRTTIMNEDYDEADDDSVLPDTPEQETDEEEDAMADFDSEAGSVGSSEVDSEPGVQDSEDEEMETEYANAYKSPASHEASTLAPEPSTVQPKDLFGLEDIQTPLPRLDAFGQHTDSNSMTRPMVFSDPASIMLNSQSHETAPPLPPRSASRPSPWSNTAYATYDNRSWLSDAIQQPTYMSTNYGDRSSLFSPAPPPPAQESVEARAPADALFGNYPSLSFQADRLQTPPMIPASDVETSTPLQPGRRTKVSIEEIVEDQPPTPESVHNMKRKADVLEEPAVEEAVEVPDAAAFITQVEPSGEVVAVPANDAAAIAVQTATIIAQRPKKTPRSVLSRVLKNATYPLLGATGAVVSFALLSTLPDTFFV
jgi:hypothetical protein